MKIAVLYHSETGNTKKVAEMIASSAKRVSGVEAKAMSIDDVDESFVVEAKAIVFGCPTYCGTFSWQMKKFFDTTSLQLTGKLGGVFITENYIGGGADFAELSLIGCMLVRSMLVYSGGVFDGKPVTHFGAVLIKEGDESQQERANVFGQKIARKALELF